MRRDRESTFTLEDCLSWLQAAHLPSCQTQRSSFTEGAASWLLNASSSWSFRLPALIRSLEEKSKAAEIGWASKAAIILKRQWPFHCRKPSLKQPGCRSATVVSALRIRQTTELHTVLITTTLTFPWSLGTTHRCCPRGSGSTKPLLALQTH